MRIVDAEVEEATEVMEVEEVEDKISSVHFFRGDFSGPRHPQVPLPPQLPPPAIPGWSSLHNRLAAPVAFLLVVFALPPAMPAQDNSQTSKPSETAGAKDSAPALSHDISGVWMQYPDGDVPGVPGMNAVTFRGAGGAVHARSITGIPFGCPSDLKEILKRHG